MEGIAEAIDRISEMAKESVKSSVLNITGDKNGSYYLVKPDGTAERKLVDAPWHRESLATPEELAKFIMAAEGHDHAQLFYDESSVVYLFDKEDRRDRASCALKPSDQYLWLKAQVTNPAQFRQPAFVRLVRITLAGCFPDPNFLNLVRNLKFSSGAEAAGNIQHGKESIGRSITAAVMGEAAMPEDVTLLIPIFNNFGERLPVRCALELFPHEQSFSLTPYPQELSLAMDRTMQSLEAILTAEDMPPAFRGQPDKA